MLQMTRLALGEEVQIRLASTVAAHAGIRDGSIS